MPSSLTRHMVPSSLGSTSTAKGLRLGSTESSSQILGGSHRPSDLFLVPLETEACYPRPAEGIKKAKICKEQSECLITHTDCPAMPWPCPPRVPASSKFPNPVDVPLALPPLLSVPSQDLPAFCSGLHPQSPSSLISSMSSSTPRPPSAQPGSVFWVLWRPPPGHHSASQTQVW